MTSIFVLPDKAGGMVDRRGERLEKTDLMRRAIEMRRDIINLKKLPGEDKR